MQAFPTRNGLEQGGLLQEHDRGRVIITVNAQEASAETNSLLQLLASPL
jgi:hypothetical protein